MRAVLFLCLALACAITPVQAKLRITVDLSRQTMTVENGGWVDYRWKVSTARAGFRTPAGKFRPYLLKRMHYSRKYDNAPMPYSIFFLGGYAIHATPHTAALGRPASHGCVRLHPRHAARLFAMVRQAGPAKTLIRIVP